MKKIAVLLLFLLVSCGSAPPPRRQKSRFYKTGEHTLSWEIVRNKGVSDEIIGYIRNIEWRFNANDAPRSSKVFNARFVELGTVTDYGHVRKIILNHQTGEHEYIDLGQHKRIGGVSLLLGIKGYKRYQTTIRPYTFEDSSVYQEWQDKQLEKLRQFELEKKKRKEKESGVKE